MNQVKQKPRYKNEKFPGKENVLTGNSHVDIVLIDIEDTEVADMINLTKDIITESINGEHIVVHSKVLSLEKAAIALTLGTRRNLARITKDMADAQGTKS